MLCNYLGKFSFLLQYLLDDHFIYLFSWSFEPSNSVEISKCFLFLGSIFLLHVAFVVLLIIFPLFGLGHFIEYVEYL